MKKIIYTFAMLISTHLMHAQVWSELGGLNGLAANSVIFSVCSDASGNIYAAGSFTNSSGKYYVAKYNGSGWSELGGLNGLAADNTIESVCSDASGNIYAAGRFYNSSSPIHRYVAKWNGSTWSELGGLNGLAANEYIRSICSDVSGNIYAAGLFTNSSGKYYVAMYGSAIGINENSALPMQLTISPNPTNGQFVITTPEPIHTIEVSQRLCEPIADSSHYRRQHPPRSVWQHLRHWRHWPIWIT